MSDVPSRSPKPARTKLSDGLEALSRFIIGGAIASIVLITIVSVFYRYVLNAPLSSEA